MSKNLTIDRILLGIILVICVLIVTKNNGGNIGIARDASQFDSDVYISKTLEVAGTSTLTGTSVLGTVTATTVNTSALNATGAATLSSTVKVDNTSSSTIQIGSTASGIGVGCIVLGDSAGSTTKPVYITATGATITASTTKPTICK